MSQTVDLVQTANYVELDWYDESEVVQVRPRDKQRFELQKDRAIEVLRAAKEVDRFQKQFEFLLNTLASWAVHWNTKISAAIVTLQDGSLAFIVVQKNEKYDEEFQDHSFLDKRLLLLIYHDGERDRLHQIGQSQSRDPA